MKKKTQNTLADIGIFFGLFMAVIGVIYSTNLVYNFANDKIDKRISNQVERQLKPIEHRLNILECETGLREEIVESYLWNLTFTDCDDYINQ